jgi:hypothetical protein
MGWPASPPNEGTSAMGALWLLAVVAIVLWIMSSGRWSS